MPMNGILKKERKYSSNDRQYSYEQTLLGSYRADDKPVVSGAESAAAAAPSPIDGAVVGGKAADRLHGADKVIDKKSVRFDEHDPREQWKEERGVEGYFAGAKSPERISWLQQLRISFSWKSIRMVLIDWFFLAAFGIGMALMSMFMDNIIEYLQKFQLFIMGKSGQTGYVYLDYVCTYLSWILYTELLVFCSATIVHYMAPQAIGSGIPEMKTVLRGVVLKDFLTMSTLVAKVVSLTFTLGSGLPIGKMGPFVHIAAAASNVLSNMIAKVEGAYGNECRKSEMLAAACATGVACTFSAPVGGVLFAIEVTTMYFSVRNYWRAFFAAACGATVFRLLRVLVLETEVTLVAFYPTHFPQDAFQPEELPFFALIGLICGLMGAGFIWFYKSFVMFLRQNEFAKGVMQRNWLVYPSAMAFIVASITYPRGYGRFLSGRYKFTRTVLDFFSNCTWSKPMMSAESPHGCTVALLASWTNHEGYGPYNVFLVLFLFIVTFLFLSALCNTMPIPCGMFMPLFVVGAALGRLVGELISVMFPDGIPGNTSNQPIFPGVYAVVGAAALTGGITHSVSVAMICCEITGQLIYIIPLMIAVIIANAVCAYFQPSVYDVMIRIKHLPYLPDLPPSNADVHSYTAEQIMVSPVLYLCRQCTYADIRNVLVDMPRLRAFPVVEESSSMMLLGSVSRRVLYELLSKHFSDEARKEEAERRIRDAISTIDRHFREQLLKLSDDDPPEPDAIDKKRDVAERENEDRPRAEGEPPDMKSAKFGVISGEEVAAAKKVLAASHRFDLAKLQANLTSVSNAIPKSGGATSLSSLFNITSANNGSEDGTGMNVPPSEGSSENAGRSRKTSVNLPLRKRISGVSEPLSSENKISRTLSEGSLGHRWFSSRGNKVSDSCTNNSAATLQRALSSEPPQPYSPMSTVGVAADDGNGDDYPIVFEAKRKNRFVIETVNSGSHQNGGGSASSGFASARSVFAISPKRQSSSGSPILPAVAPLTRGRRNAISSSIPTSNASASAFSDAEDHIVSRTNSGASTPSKSSFGWSGSYDNQNSLTRSITDYVKQAKRRIKHARHKSSMDQVEHDLYGDERREWELARLQDTVEFDEKQIDPAPFQLVRRTSVYKVHSLFSMLDLNRAYVTDRGRLVGVVALRDLRLAIENSQNGLPLNQPSPQQLSSDVESGLSSTLSTSSTNDVSSKKSSNDGGDDGGGGTVTSINHTNTPCGDQLPSPSHKSSTTHQQSNAKFPSFKRSYSIDVSDLRLIQPTATHRLATATTSPTTSQDEDGTPPLQPRRKFSFISLPPSTFTSLFERKQHKDGGGDSLNNDAEEINGTNFGTLLPQTVKIHYLNNYPMLSIQEEEESDLAASRKSSLKRKVSLAAVDVAAAVAVAVSSSGGEGPQSNVDTSPSATIIATPSIIELNTSHSDGTTTTTIPAMSINTAAGEQILVAAATPVALAECDNIAISTPTRGGTASVSLGADSPAGVVTMVSGGSASINLNEDQPSGGGSGAASGGGGSTGGGSSCDVSAATELPVVHAAMEYLRRKSLAVADLKVLEETPLPEHPVGD